MPAPTPVVDLAVHIASLVIHVRPSHLPAFQHWLQTSPDPAVGVELHAASEQGKLVVVVEAGDEKRILTLMDVIREQPGVLNTALVYHEIIQAEIKD